MLPAASSDHRRYSSLTPAHDWLQPPAPFPAGTSERRPSSTREIRIRSKGGKREGGGGIVNAPPPRSATALPVPAASNADCACRDQLKSITESRNEMTHLAQFRLQGRYLCLQGGNLSAAVTLLRSCRSASSSGPTRFNSCRQPLIFLHEDLNHFRTSRALGFGIRFWR